MDDLELIFPESEKNEKDRKKISPKKVSQQPIKQATTKPPQHDTVIPRHHDAIIEKIRLALKSFGKEAATHRFTIDEKKAIKKIVFSYNLLNITTSENEIARISINYVIEDYYENGENSILSIVIDAMNA